MNSKWIRAAAVRLASMLLTGAASASESDHAQDQREKNDRPDPLESAAESVPGDARGVGDVEANQPSRADTRAAGGDAESATNPYPATAGAQRAQRSLRARH